MAALVAAWLAGCGGAPAQPPARVEVAAPVADASITAVAAPPPVVASRDPASGGDGEAFTRVALDIPGFLPAVVAVPPGSARLPLVVATHGAGGAPEWYCEHLPALFGGSAFVLCPRGRRVSRFEPDAGFYYADHHALLAELRAALVAFAARFGARADLESPVYFGFSQGAEMGALVLPELPFRRAILAEGASGVFTVHLAQRFHAAGGQRILFGCGQASCAAAARTSVGWVERAGVGARLALAPGAGHTFGGAVATAVAASLPWLLENDPRFRLRAE